MQTLDSYEFLIPEQQENRRLTKKGVKECVARIREEYANKRKAAARAYFVIGRELSRVHAAIAKRGRSSKYGDFLRKYRINGNFDSRARKIYDFLSRFDGSSELAMEYTVVALILLCCTEVPAKGWDFQLELFGRTLDAIDEPSHRVITAKRLRKLMADMEPQNETPNAPEERIAPEPAQLGSAADQGNAPPAEQDLSFARRWFGYKLQELNPSLKPLLNENQHFETCWTAFERELIRLSEQEGSDA